MLSPLFFGLGLPVQSNQSSPSSPVLSNSLLCFLTLVVIPKSFKRSLSISGFSEETYSSRLATSSSVHSRGRLLRFSLILFDQYSSSVSFYGLGVLSKSLTTPRLSSAIRTSLAAPHLFDFSRWILLQVSFNFSTPTHQ